MKTPQVSVGIMSSQVIEFTLNSHYLVKGQEVAGLQSVQIQNGQIVWNNILYDELIFIPIDTDKGSFELKDVTIGVNFHWERKENQTFRGSLLFSIDNNEIAAINILPVEEYLISVISSEMSANASLELLKAHAVISRSWLLAQIQKNKDAVDSKAEPFESPTLTPEERIIWYDREDHLLFDVCADDHCQRYQGITRATNALVRQAVLATEGEVLTYNNRICDARYSKCCGGMLEEFSTCWEKSSHPYLVKKRDWTDNENSPNLKDEDQAQKWILGSPDAFCNTKDKVILRQVLNNYDQETTDFYRWEISYSQDEIRALIKKNLGMEFGDIIDLEPVARGVSSRLYKLRIVGSQKTLVLGKELEIRRVLSNSHLYSSAFVVERKNLSNQIPQEFVLKGAGWGHGVGLCQIGAAVMGEKGYSYDEILLHYYVSAQIDKHY